MAFQDLVVQGVSSGGNWISAVERIKAELTRNRPEDDDFIKRALATRMKFYSSNRFAFNEGQQSLLTKKDIVEYGPEDPLGSGTGYPADLITIDRVHIFQNEIDPATGEPLGGDPGRAYPMERVDADDMRYWTDSLHGGTRPYFYAFFNNRFFIYPKPSAVYRLRFDYLKDIDRPRYQFVDGEWRYFDGTGSPVEDDYSTPWLEHAEELIRNGAKADLFANVFSDEGSVPTARGQEMAALRQLKAERGRLLSKGRVRPHFGGEYYGEFNG